MNSLDDWIPTFFVVAISVVLVFLFWSLHREGQEWEKFRVDHNCKVVAKIPGDVFNTIGFGANGAMIVGMGATADKTGFACDDGVTYYR